MLLRLFFLLFFVLNSCTSKKDIYTNTMEAFSELSAESKPVKTRALWIVRKWITSPEKIDRILDIMQELALNKALVQVRGLANSYYGLNIEPQAHDIENKDFIPLAYFLKEAQKRKISVEAWVNVFLVAKPKTRLDYKEKKHLLFQKPHWFLRNKQGLLMTEYSEERLKEIWVDGYYLDPALKEVQDYSLSLFDKILAAYPALSGLHLDFIRYPYSREDSEHDFGIRSDFRDFAKKHYFLEEEANPSDFRALANMERKKNVTAFVKRLSKLMKQKYPQKKLSAAVWAHAKKAQKNVFQDWGLWIDEELIDHAYMMIYVKDLKFHKKRILEVYQSKRAPSLVFGLGLYRNPSWGLVKEQLRSSQAFRVEGFSLFSSKYLQDLSPQKLQAFKKLLE